MSLVNVLFFIRSSEDFQSVLELLCVDLYNICESCKGNNYILLITK